MALKLQPMLKQYITQYRPNTYLFEGAPDIPYTASSARAVFGRALKKVGIQKHITLHGLRHGYATHSMENGTDIRYIQTLLGHNDPKTTMIYTHISKTSINQVVSPFDSLG